MASGDDDGVIKIWNLETGNCLNTWKAHAQKIRSLNFNSTGERLISTGADSAPGADQTRNSIRLWRIQGEHSEELLQSLEGHPRMITSLAFHVNNQILVSGSSDGTAKIWDLESRSCLLTLDEHVDWVWAVAISPCGNVVATGSADNSVKLWDLPTGKCLKSINTGDGPVFAVAFHPSGLFLASSSIKSTVKFWDTETGECMATLRDRIYEGLNITGVKGLTKAEKESLKQLGAVEYESSC